MKWNKTLIEINNLPMLRLRMQEQIKTANPTIEQIRCIFGYKESNTVYAYTAFDFLDNYDVILTQGHIDRFYIYQPFNAS